MSDDRSGARTIVDDSLLARFENARDALTEYVAVKPGLERFHRPDAETDDPAPACTPAPYGDWRTVKVDEALLAGFTPCRTCWRSVLEYLASAPDSAVAYRSDDATPEPRRSPTDAPFPPEGNDTERPCLSSPTDEVMIDGGTKYHAPAGGETLCGRTGYRVVDRCAVESHYEPCLDCFTDVGE